MELDARDDVERRQLANRPAWRDGVGALVRCENKTITTDKLTVQGSGYEGA